MVGIVMHGVLWLPTPRADVDALHAALCGLWQHILGMAVLVHSVPLAQRTEAVWGMAPGVCSGHPILPWRRGCSSGAGEASFASSQFSRWFLSNLSPFCHCFAELWCSHALLLCGGRRELCHRVGIRGGGGSPSAVGRTNVIDLLWHLIKPQSPLPKSLSDSLIS